MDLRTLTDEQLEQHHVDVLTEQERRQRLAQAPTQVAQIARSYVAGGGSLPRSHRLDACSSPNLGDGIIKKMHGINQNRAIASVLYTRALTNDEIQRVLNWLTALYLT